jgi:hypothetical protein
MKDTDDEDVVFRNPVENQVLACDKVANAGAKVIAWLARKRMVAQLLHAEFYLVNDAVRRRDVVDTYRIPNVIKIAFGCG